MPKSIPEAMRLEIRDYYQKMVKRVRISKWKGVTRRENACHILQEQFPRYFKGLSIEEVHILLYMPSKEDVELILKDAICPRCGHGDNLKLEPKGANDDGVPQSGFDIYCTSPERNSTIFSKCWYHLGRSEK